MRVSGAITTRLASSRSPRVTGENKSMSAAMSLRTVTIPEPGRLRRSSLSGDQRSVLNGVLTRGLPGVPGLRAVHRPVRADDQLVGRLTRLPDGDPHADTDRELPRRSGERAADLLAHLRREGGQPILVTVPADQHELVAADPGDHVIGAGHGAQPGG